jgi:hypothetical protein
MASTIDPLASAQLVSASQAHIERLRAVVKVSRQQASLARALIDEAQDYMVLIEKIEAARIELLREHSK